MNSIGKWLKLAAAFGVLSVAGCYHKDSMNGTSVELVTVDARKFEVRISPTGTSDQYRMLIIRATMVINPDAENEMARAEVVAQRYMKQTCKQRPFEEILAGLEGDINYRVLFQCN